MFKVRVPVRLCNLFLRTPGPTSCRRLDLYRAREKTEAVACSADSPQKGCSAGSRMPSTRVSSRYSRV